MLGVEVLIATHAACLPICQAVTSAVLRCQMVVFYLPLPAIELSTPNHPVCTTPHNVLTMTRVLLPAHPSLHCTAPCIYVPQMRMCRCSQGRPSSQQQQSTQPACRCVVIWGLIEGVNRWRCVWVVERGAGGGM